MQHVPGPSLVSLKPQQCLFPANVIQIFLYYRFLSTTFLKLSMLSMGYTFMLGKQLCVEIQRSFWEQATTKFTHFIHKKFGNFLIFDQKRVCSNCLKVAVHGANSDSRKTVCTGTHHECKSACSTAYASWFQSDSYFLSTFF